ncbi:MAG: sigma 54-interacting transcriptional regulator [Phycisphaerae bacterium]|nr:sigma 54-interacting transcriptional regulator [Phycisphaerae bacterium]
MGDNIVWEVDSGALIDKFVSSYISACDVEGAPVIYVSFNRSPQTIVDAYGPLMSANRFHVIDCFSSGKGSNDDVFLEFYQSETSEGQARSHLVDHPADQDELLEVLRTAGLKTAPHARYLFDSLTGMYELWHDEDTVLRFFGHFCPRLFDVNTVAYWLLEKEAHTEPFLAKLRHISQVVVEIAMSRGIRTLTLRKAINRRCAEIGVPQWFRVVDGNLVVAAESREDRELGLLTRMGDALGTALDPRSFYEKTMEALANELGMARGTLVLLERTHNKLLIAAAHGLSQTERARGEYTLGEGITGHVVQSGIPEVIPDISKDARFLNRTATRKIDAAHPIAFICVPIKVDGEAVGALSIDRPFAVGSMLDKDLRLLLIVASIISQVLKINRLIHVDKEEILERDQQVLEDLRRRYRLENLVGQSEAIERVLSVAATAAKSRAAILLTGETGTGKELVANLIHYNSDRTHGPFIKVNCGALPETLLESELFGHIKGAFTGAVETRKGRFELADTGTLLLDEVAEMSPRLQVKLLRVLQEREFEPVGGTKTIKVDVRLLAATSKDLRQEIRDGRFREDLFYRLNVIPIHLPPLRERRKDIPLLVDNFLDKYNRQNNKYINRISPKVLDLLLDYPWPGNVRELENCIERCVVMSPGTVLSPDFLPEEITRRSHTLASGEHRDCDESEISRLTQRVCERTANLAQAKDAIHQTVDRTIIRHALALIKSQRKVADALGMSRMTLRKKIREYGIGD